MRFSDLFYSYKIGLKGIKGTIPYSELPLYRKIEVVAVFVTCIIALLMHVFRLIKIACIFWSLEIILLILFILINSRKNNLEVMLREHYIPYSEKRMNMTICVLENFGIKVTDIEAIDLLIQEAQLTQTQNDYLAPLKIPLRILTTIIIPIVAYVAAKIGDSLSQGKIIVMAAFVIVVIIMISVIILSIAPFIKNLINRDYNKYSELISDLRQIKIFYSKGIRVLDEERGKICGQ